MTTLSASVDVDASAQQTWDVVVDWERQGEWIPLTDVQVDSGTPVGVGTEICARSGIGSAGFVDPMVIDVWQPPYRCEVVHLGKVVTGRGRFLVDDLPGGRSRFTWEEELASTGARRFVDPFGAPLARPLTVLAVRRLARLVSRGR